MFRKLKQWNLNRKLIKEINLKKVDYLKVQQLIIKGADFAHVMKPRKNNNFDMMQFLRNKSTNPTVNVLKTFYLQQIENLVYRQYEKNIRKDFLSDARETTNTETLLQKFGMKINEDRIKSIKHVVTTEYMLKHTTKFFSLEFQTQYKHDLKRARNQQKNWENKDFPVDIKKSETLINQEQKESLVSLEKPEQKLSNTRTSSVDHQTVVPNFAS